MTYYRGIKVQDEPKKETRRLDSGVYRGVSWTNENLSKPSKAQRKGIYRGVKWVA
tara:strand:- start:813 stop:977 length:165 start_codon:yes stop_codon:yes gene_type:complete